MKLHVLWPFAFGLVFMLTVNSCTKTVAGPTVVDSTTIRDTLRDTLGTRQAWVRFVSMFPDSIATTIVVSKTQGAASSLFAYAVNSMAGSFIPLHADTSYTFQLSSSTLPSWSESLPIPVLGNTLNTFALFYLNNQAWPARSIDSEYLTPPPPGYCYVRCIDGIADGSQYYLDLDTVYKDLAPIQNLQISQYVLVSKGVHTLLLRTSGSLDTPLQSQPNNFEDGSYYTVRATGSFAANNAKLTIDQE